MKKAKQKKDEFGPPGSEHPMTCKELLEEFWKTKHFLSEASKRNYQSATARFFNHFEESMTVDRLTRAQMTRWKSKLLLTFAPATVAHTLTIVKSVFHFAVGERWLPSNPLDEIDCGSFKNPDTDRFVTAYEFKRIVEKCQSSEQRAILTFSRFGGLRCPSEVLRLKWSDIHWKEKSISIQSCKKTNVRIIPLFPVLRQALKEVLDDLPGRMKGEYVFEDYRTTVNFGPMFGRLAKEAGLDRIPRPFDNMRSSRGVELYNEFGRECALVWMGYSCFPDFTKTTVRFALESQFQRATEWEEGV